MGVVALAARLYFQAASREKMCWTTMSATDDEANPYELLDVKLESSEADIRRAYRQRSLKVHPDRVCLLNIPPERYRLSNIYCL